MRKHAVKFYLDGLNGTVCQCGGWKKFGMSFCSTCFYALPAYARRNLYRKILRGYESAYDRAIAILEAARSKQQRVN